MSLAVRVQAFNSKKKPRPDLSPAAAIMFRKLSEKVLVQLYHAVADGSAVFYAANGATGFDDL